MIAALHPLAESAAGLLRARGDDVAVAESSTGGLISAALLAIPGASTFFMGGAVIYTRTSRSALLRVDLDDHPGTRPSTEAYALLMARSIRELLGTTWGLGETGASGPDGNRYGDPAGHSCLAIDGPLTRSVTVATGSGDREANMARFASAALTLLERTLRERA